jgi:hypothetical protein
LVSTRAQRELEDGETGFELPGLEQLGGCQSGADQGTHPGNRVLEAKRVGRGDFENAPDRVDLAEPGEVVRGGDRAFPLPPDAPETLRLRDLVRFVRVVPEAEARVAPGWRAAVAAAGHPEGAASPYHPVTSGMTQGRW